MDRRAKLFAATTVTLGVTSAWLALQLSNERERAAMLAERVAMLETSPEPLSGSREAEADPTPAADRDPSATPAEPDSSQIALLRRDTEARLARLRVNEAKLLRDTLGESKYRQWIDYQRTAEGRQELECWRIELATAGLALTPDQAQVLMTAAGNHDIELRRAHSNSTGSGSQHRKIPGTASPLIRRALLLH